MMKSYDINIFMIPFQNICDSLQEFGIDFNWDEKGREAAIDAWERYISLSPAQRQSIGIKMIELIKDDLENLVLGILDDTADREIEKIIIEVKSNLGEVRTYEFSSIEEAIGFLNYAELKNVFITTDSLSLFDPPPSIEEDDDDDMNQLPLF